MTATSRQPAPPPPPHHTPPPMTAGVVPGAGAGAAGAAFPTEADLARATRTHRQGPFAIASRKLPISKAGPIAALEADLGIPVPEMIFGDNLLAVSHAPSGWAIAFRARDALDGVDKTGLPEGGLLQVAHARSWAASRERAGDTRDIMEVVRPFDWSYSTAYRGTVTVPGSSGTGTGTGTGTRSQHGPGDGTATDTVTTTTGSGAQQQGEEREESKEEQGRPNHHQNQNHHQQEEDSSSSSSSSSRDLRFRPTTKAIPLELLKRRDPILFFDEVVLYESELDDNGVSVLSAKVRVHERRLLLLCRLFLRVDGVVVRVRDARVYVDFDAEEVTREYTAREAAFEDARRALLMTGLRPDEITIALRDANKIADLLPIVEQTLESVTLKS
ncbi:Tap42 interacting protein [Diatrype stigma]|uniref:Tap42 interacting protein n=1 Tax=Diatrype stigma TaxID=117547 RepID=A0AAN9YG19_9PEZI